MAKSKKEAPESAIKPRRMSGAALQAALSLVAVLLGVLLTFVPNVDVRVLCYIFCAALIAGGVIAIVYFFMTGSYKRLDDYNFALGVMLVILGCCGIARINDLEGGFLLCMGLLTLIIGIVVLQNTVQLRVVGNTLWVLPLIFTAAVLFGGISILVNFQAVWDLLGYWILILSGALGLIALILTAIVLRRNAKREEKAAEEAEKAPAEPPAKEHGFLKKHEASTPILSEQPAPEETPAPPEAEVEKDPFADLWPDDPPSKE